MKPPVPAAETDVDLALLLATARDHEAAAEVAIRAHVDRLARQLAVPGDDVDPRRSMHTFGIDSLIALS
jgi:hypothetical protein